MKNFEKFLQAGLILLLAGAPFLSGTFELWGVTPLRLGALLLITFLFLSLPLTFQTSEWRATRVIFLPMAALFLWGSLSLIYSTERLESFQVLLSWGYNFSLFFLAYTLFKDSLAFKRTIQAFLVATAVLCFYGLYQYYFAYEAILQEVLADPQKFGGLRVVYLWPLFNRQPLATFINPNIFALHLALAIIFALGLWWEIGKPALPWRRLVLFFLYPLFLLLALYCFILIGSRGALLATLGGILVSIILLGTQYLKARRLHWLIFAFIITAVVTFRLVTYPGPPEMLLFKGERSIASPKTEAQPRAQFYRAAGEMIKRKPLHGWGLGTFGTVYHQFRQEDADYTKFAHSFPLQLAAEAGLIGVVLWAILMGGIIALLLKGWRGLQQRWEPYMSTLLCSSLLILFLHSLVDFDMEVVGLSTFFWIGLGTLAGALNPKAAEEPPSMPLWQKLLCVLPFTILTAFLIFVPFWAQTLALEGQNYLAAQKNHKAVDAFKYSLLINSYDPKTYASLSRAYQELYKKEGENAAFLDESQQAIERAIKLSPDNYAYHQGLGRVFWMRAQKDKEFLDDTEGELLKAAQLAPYSLGVHQDLLFFYRDQDRPEDAQKEEALVKKLEDWEKSQLRWYWVEKALKERFAKEKTKEKQ